MAVEFGTTAWGRAWVRIVQPTGAMPDTLLPKARTMARLGQLALEIEPGTITAKAKDGNNTWSVQIDVPLWPADIAGVALSQVSAAQAAACTALTDDLPDSLIRDLDAAGARVAVALPELRPTCDCRSRRRPCAHILATLYQLALQIDERPRLALELRTDSGMPEAPGSDWIPLRRLDPDTFYRMRPTPDPFRGTSDALAEDLAAG